MEVVARTLADHTPPGNPLGHRIEHCTLSGPEALKSMASADLIPVPQMAFLRERSEDFARALGTGWMQQVFPLRSWIRAGLRPIHSSDAPVTRDTRPLLALATAVTRTDQQGRSWGSDEAISVEEGLAMLTEWPARADGEGHVRGKMRIGHRADLVVLDHDPLRERPEDYAEIVTLMTIVGGSVAWTADQRLRSVTESGVSA